MVQLEKRCMWLPYISPWHAWHRYVTIRFNVYKSWTTRMRTQASISTSINHLLELLVVAFFRSFCFYCAVVVVHSPNARFFLVNWISFTESSRGTNKRINGSANNMVIHVQRQFLSEYTHIKSAIFQKNMNKSSCRNSFFRLSSAKLTMHETFSY